MKRRLYCHIIAGESGFNLSDTTGATLAGLEFVTELEEGFKFYRRKASGTMTFTGSDYKRLKAIEDGTCCKTGEIVFLNTCDDSVYFRGRFKFADMNINVSSYSMILNKIDTIDGYDTIFSKWLKEINVMTDPIKPAFYYLADSGDPTGKQFFGRGRYVHHVLWYMLRDMLGETSTLIPASFLDIGSVFNDSDRWPDTYNLVYYDGSDFVYPRSSEETTKAIWTFKDFQQTLQDTFNFHWFLNDAGMIQWEHESYFPQRTYGSSGPVVDLSTDEIMSLNKVNKGYKSDYSKLYGKFELTIPGNQQLFEDFKQIWGPGVEAEYPMYADFSKGSITYDSDAVSDCVLRDDKGEIQVDTKQISRLVTDVQHVNIATQAFTDDDGNPLDTFKANIDRSSSFLFLKLAPVDGQDYQTIASDKTDIYNAQLVNGAFAATNLVRNYYRSEMSFNVGTFNIYKDNILNFSGIQRSATSVLLTRILTELNMKMCCGDSFPVDAKFVSWAGLGRLIRADMTMKDETSRIAISVETACNKILNLPEPGNPENPCPERDIVVDSGSDLFNEFDHQGNPIEVYRPYEVRTDGNCGTYKIYI